MNFLQQIGFGGIPGMGFSTGWPGGGLNFLLGSPMGFGFPGGMPMGDPYSMYQMMSQFFAQQPQQPQQGQGGYPAWQAAQTNNPTFEPDRSQSPYDQMRALRNFANKNGSRDGTPVADWTSPQQDISAGNYLTQLTEKQSDLVLHELRNASPEERALLKAEEEKLQQQIKQREADGRPMTGSEKLRAQVGYTDRLYSEGKLNDRLGGANRQLQEITDYGDQTYANMFLKAGAPLPADMPREAVERSPYNRNNQQPPQPQPQQRVA